MKGWIKVFECCVATQGVTRIYSWNSQVYLFPVQICKREISIFTANLCLSCIIKPEMPHFKGLPVVLPKARNSFRSFGSNMHPGDALWLGNTVYCLGTDFSFSVALIDNDSHYWLSLLFSLLTSQCVCECGLYVRCCYIMCEL